jgi:hypothetical protein
MNLQRIRRFIISRATGVLLGGIALFVVGFAVWPGCALAPLPSKRVPIVGRSTTQFKLKKSEHPTRGEVIARLGQPDAYVEDIRVACYRVKDVTRRKVFLLLFVIPISVEHRNAYDIGFIEFDEEGLARRADIRTEYESVSLKDAARKWLAEKQKNDRK